MLLLIVFCVALWSLFIGFWIGLALGLKTADLRVKTLTELFSDHLKKIPPAR